MRNRNSPPSIRNCIYHGSLGHTLFLTSPSYSFFPSPSSYCIYTDRRCFSTFVYLCISSPLLSLFHLILSLLFPPPFFLLFAPPISFTYPYVIYSFQMRTSYRHKLPKRLLSNFWRYHPAYTYLDYYIPCILCMLLKGELIYCLT